MESADLKKPVNGNWEVYKDAFAPPPPSRTIKAWERAPVPAHAPRLQGQKIWKRAVVKSQREQDKGNFDAVQKELQTEGAGARKRLRRGVKENIGDATWKEDAKLGANEDTLDHATKGESGTPIPLNDSNANALQFVPRKRTNSNHVITPRKPLRQSTLNAQAQTQAFMNPPQPSPEKPVRRRKSMRKSIRTSMVGSVLDFPAAQVEGNPSVSETVTEVPSALTEEKSTVGDSVTEINYSKPAQPDLEEPAAEPTLNDKLNKLFGLTDDEQPINQEPEQTLEDKVTRSPVAPISKQNAKVPLNDVEEAPEDISRPSQVEEKVPMNIGDEESSRGRQSAILETVETDANTHASTPRSKRTNTPKKKRGTSQRRGTRRSTRTTRASSVRADEQAAVPEVNGALGEPTKHPLEITLHALEEPAEATLVVESEPVIEEESAAKNDHIPESRPIAESKTFKPVDITDPKASPVSDKLESFDISAKQTLESSANNIEQNMTDEDFELPPSVISSENASLNTPHEEAKSEEFTGVKSIPADESSEIDSSPLKFSPTDDDTGTELPPNSEEFIAEVLEHFEPISVFDSGNVANENNTMSPSTEVLPETSTPDPTTSELVEAISENAPPTAYDHDDTDMLRNFLTRVKANKAAKAGTQIPKRKRSLPHSPLRLPLGEADTDISPSDQKMKDKFDVGPPGPSPSKRQKRNDPIVVDEDDTITERRPTRRSGRTRLPVVKTPLGAPSHIPVRRLGQEGDSTVTLKRSEEKELAALTRVNTRKNKGGSQSVPEVLAKKTGEKEDPVLRQKFLKEIFDEKAQKGRKKIKTVVWAEELTQFQTVEGRKLDGDKEKEKEVPKVAPAEEKKGAVKVGIRSKIALGMAANGTPAPKRKRTRS